jgi:membrane fusion protein, multidrug efflux system
MGFPFGGKMTNTEIHAPIDGRIGLANHTVGNLVGPSSGILATIVSQGPIYVIFQATERDILEYKRRLYRGSYSDPVRDRLSHREA